MKPARTLEHRAVKLLTSLHLGRRKPVQTLSTSQRRDRRRTLNWGWRSQVRGIAAGLKQSRRPELHGLPCITIYVRSKVPEHRLPATERIPKRLRLDSLGQDVITDVVELRGQITAHAATLVKPGDEVAHELGERGTLGLLVQEDGNQDVLAVGCSHVLARSGAGAAENDRVEHPLDVNADPDQNCFGRLTSTFTVLSTDRTTSEDFALARVDVPFDLDTGGLTVSGIVDSTAGIASGTPTRLVGLRTSNALGSVINGTWSGTINDVPFVGDVDFENLVSYQTNCVPGDSGGAVLQDGTSLALGIHVGGSAADNFGLFMPLWPVFQRLGLQVIAKKGKP